MGSFKLFRDSKGEYRFNLLADNYKVILTASEGYDSKQGCLNGIDSVREYSKTDSRFDRRDGNVYFSFNLVASNGRILARSETYVSKTGRDGGIDDVKRLAPRATVNDETLAKSY